MKGKNPALWEEVEGYSNDLAFAHNLAELNIPIHCDTRIKFMHLRYVGQSQKGKKSPIVEFIKNRNPSKSDVAKDKVRSSS
jgi:hypothetical protein